MTDIDTPQGVAHMDPSGMVGRIYEGGHLTWLHKKYEISGLCGFGDLYMISFYLKSMGANDTPPHPPLRVQPF